MDDFEKMDADSGVLNSSVVLTNDSVVTGNSIVSYRDKLIKEYHGGHDSIVERISDANTGISIDSLLSALIEEVIKETDHLLGNELIATQNGDHRDSSVISYKRVEAIEKAIKAVATKKEIEKDSALDVDSPSIAIIFRFFMAKVNETFEKMALADELKDLFFINFGEVTSSWKKELKQHFSELKK